MCNKERLSLESGKCRGGGGGDREPSTLPSAYSYPILTFCRGQQPYWLGEIRQHVVISGQVDSLLGQMFFRDTAARVAVKEAKKEKDEVRVRLRYPQ